MAISLDQIREELYPGLAGVVGRYPGSWRYCELAQLKAEGRTVLYDPWYELATPHVWVPKPVELVATAAAVAIINNPIVTRRFWQGWLK